ncbi:MAG: acetate/propionate family kinase [Acidobacteria bacterium]|nr:acetate/propionate family kinase [Acidobacteriota bacterium]MBV9186607.1 acetate/propionate family kinase [Acidobacteriota bacterium]
MKILVLNPGSSSMKSAVYEMPGEKRAAEGEVDAVGVRVVHGGSRFETPAIVDDAVLDEIGKLSALAPLHNPLAVKAIEDVRRERAGIPIVAVFDTAFHRTLPPVASTYAIPQDLGIRRYGFHGISYSYVSKRLHALDAGDKLIVAHLGNGASVCAIRGGRSIDTSMGFTPMEGLVMGTRAGDLDPGAILYLLRNGATDLDDLLNHRSGLLGLSGITGDVRELSASSDPNAQLALDVFAYRAAKYIASYCAALDGVDAIAFTAGIGEHSASMRQRICERLRFLDVILDDAANRAPRTDERRISAGRVGVWVIPTNEELEIARSTYEVLSA